MTRWKCGKCSYIYDQRLGDPDGGIPPGTPFEQIPTGWRCPICGATKEDFYVIGGVGKAGPAQPRATSETAAVPPARPAQPAPVEAALPEPEPVFAERPLWTVGSLRGKPQGAA